MTEPRQFREGASTKTAAYYHATPVDLSGQQYVLPRSQTGAAPTWEDMDPSEDDLVFLSRDLAGAERWASEIAEMLGDGENYPTIHIYEVEPEGEVTETASTVAAPRARVIRRISTRHEARAPVKVDLVWWLRGRRRGRPASGPRTSSRVFTAEDFAHTSSPARTVNAVVDLLRDVEGRGYEITREDRVSGFGLIVKFTPAGEPWLHGEKLRILCYEGSPIEIYDTGRRHGTRLSLARARRKIESNGFRY